jgi:hypothetical protein
MASINVFSEHGKELIDYLKNDEDIKILYATEFLTHDGYDKDGPKSDIWLLYVCMENLQSTEYTYSYYTEENWFDKNYKLEYTLLDKPVSCAYFVVPHSPDKYFGNTQTYYESMWRIVNELSIVHDNNWKNVYKNDLENVEIFIHDDKIEPNILELVNTV